MRIEANKVVTIDYVLKNDAGEVLDSSEGREGLSYLHGAGNIIPGLEKALADKQAGDALNVSITPEDAYGERSDEMKQTVPREMFPSPEQVSVGMQFHAQSPDGQMMVVTVVDLNDEHIVVDGNHPLAGENLHFEVQVKEVREPTQEELEHGHVHGPGGHDH